MSDSVRPHRRQPIRLPCPWDSPGKNTGVGCHFLLQCMKVKSESEVAQSRLTLCDPMDFSPPDSFVRGFPRLEYWGELPFPFPGHLPNPGIELVSPALPGGFFTPEPHGCLISKPTDMLNCIQISGAMRGKALQTISRYKCTHTHTFLDIQLSYILSSQVFWPDKRTILLSL